MRQPLPLPFDTSLLPSRGPRAVRATTYQAGIRVFRQGDRCNSVLYIQQGTVKLSVLSAGGREAVVGMLVPGVFFGEGALSGQPTRLVTATALTTCRILTIPKRSMIRLLQDEHAVSTRFISHLLARNQRLEEDLVDQLFNASERRLARLLLLLAVGSSPSARQCPPMSQTVLAQMIGSTRSRVNFFMNRFRRLGLIDYQRGSSASTTAITVEPALAAMLERGDLG